MLFQMTDEISLILMALNGLILSPIHSRLKSVMVIVTRDSYQGPEKFNLIVLLLLLMFFVCFQTLFTAWHAEFILQNMKMYLHKG